MEAESRTVISRSLGAGRMEDAGQKGQSLQLCEMNKF